MSGREDTRGSTRSSRSLAWWLDSSIPLPGGFRIGLDGIIGLIPGVGDLVGGGMSSWIFYQACRQGLPKSVLLRMAINIIIDTGLGAIPLLGDLFDFLWKANSRNLELLERYRHDPRGVVRRSTLANTGFIAVLVLLAIALFWLIAMLVRLLWTALTQNGAL